MPVKTYSPDSAFTRPLDLLRDVLFEFYLYRSLVITLFMRDLKAQYRQSFLGYIWLILPPALTSAVWLFLNSQKIIEVNDTKMPYPLFVIVGTTLWQTFTKLIQAPISSFESGKAVFTKMNVPPTAFIAAGTLQAIFELLIYSVVLVPVFIVIGETPPGTFVYLPLSILAMVTLGTSLGILAAPFASLYTDLKMAVPLIMGVLMYLSPVIYPPPASGFSATVIRLNPMTPILMFSRDVLSTGETDHLLGVISTFGASSLLLVVFAVGLRVCMPHVVARLGM